MIRFESVSFVYPGGVRALQQIDLTINERERIAVVGQNGSGKTTLVRHLNGLLKPATGRVLVGERLTTEARIAQLAATVGMAFQDPDRQIFASSVAAEVSFGARNVGLTGDALSESVQRALDAVGLTGLDATNPYDLGYSRRKLLTIASVLAMQTPIVVLDEPTAGQDARNIRTIQGIVDRVHDAGKTVVCVSHDLRFVAESFSRVIVMRAGRIVLDGTTDEVFAEQHWPVLASTNLEPPYAAKVGAALGLGSTPTQADVVRQLMARTTAN